MSIADALEFSYEQEKKRSEVLDLLYQSAQIKAYRKRSVGDGVKLSKNSFSPIAPKAEGTYLWVGEHSDNLSLITVKYNPPKDEYGLHWESYYGVIEHRMRNVEQYKGLFLKLEIV